MKNKIILVFTLIGMLLSVGSVQHNNLLMYFMGFFIMFLGYIVANAIYRRRKRKIKKKRKMENNKEQVFQIFVMTELRRSL